MKTLTISLLFALSACSADAGSSDGAPERNRDGSPSKRVRTGDEEYDGPPVEAEVDVKESQPVQYAVRVTVQAPSSGYDLERDGVEHDGEVTVVRFTLIEPEDGAIGLTVITPHSERVDLGEKCGANVRIDVRRRPRDAKPGFDPPYLAAKTIRRG